MRSGLWGLVGAVWLAACVGSLERRDGALRIEVRGAPSATARIDVHVDTEDQRFSYQTEGSIEVIDEFSAVPVGPAKVTIALFDAQDRLLIEPSATEVEIEEDQEHPVLFDLANATTVGPLQLTIVEPEAQSRYRVTGVPLLLLVEVRSDAEGILAEPEVSLSVDGAEPIPMEPSGAFLWSADIDPRGSSLELPHELSIEVTACLASVPGSCVFRSVTQRVDRELWSRSTEAAIFGTPQLLAQTSSAVMVIDREGGVFAYAIDSGEPVEGRRQLPEPAVPPKLGRTDALLLVVDSEDTLHAVEPQTLEVAWTESLPGRATPPIYSSEEDKIWIGAGTSLFELDPATGARTEVLQTPAPLGGAPYFNSTLGLVVVDTQGNGVWRRPQGELLFDVEAAVRAAPIAWGEDVAVITIQGDVHRITAEGERTVVPGRGDRVLHAPIVSGEALVFASDTKVVWVRPEGRVERSLGASAHISGSPAAWLGEAVVVGTTEGRVQIVTPQDNASVHRFEASGGPPLVLEGRRILAGGGRALKLLSVEEDFDVR